MSKNPAVLPADEWPRKVVRHTISFVRHGQKNGPGFSADLTEKGRRDAYLAGERIRYPLDLVMASPSPRAISTAMAIREGNGSHAKLVIEEQLAEPGLGMYTDFSDAMRAFFLCIRSIIDENRAETIVAATHNYVVEYVAEVFRCRNAEPGLLEGITVNLEDFFQVCESL